MGGKRSAERAEANAARATVAAEKVTTVAGKDIIDKWCKDNPDKIADLALFLVSGGLKGKKTMAVPGSMSRGTLSLTDLPKKWMMDTLIAIEPALPQDFMMKVYENAPHLLVNLWRLAQNIVADPDGKPIKISAYYPRNYIGLEHVAKIRYETFGRRLKHFAALIVERRDEWQATKLTAKNYINNFDLDQVGVWKLRPVLNELGDATTSWELLHPSGVKVPLEDRYGIDGEAKLIDNGDETTAKVVNVDGMQIQICHYLGRKKIIIPTCDRDFIAEGWAHAKQFGVLPPADEAQEEASRPLAIEGPAPAMALTDGDGAAGGPAASSSSLVPTLGDGGKAGPATKRARLTCKTGASAAKGVVFLKAASDFDLGLSAYSRAAPVALGPA